MPDDYINRLYSALEYSQTEFDKSLTFIASGLLAGSFAFIDKIVKVDAAAHKYLLVLGWAILGLAIGLATFGHSQSIKLISNSISSFKENDDTNQRSTRVNANKVIGRINNGTILLIVVGSLLIFAFILLNFYPSLCK